MITAAVVAAVAHAISAVVSRFVIGTPCFRGDAFPLFTLFTKKDHEVKITKQKLRNIIAEEKARILAERADSSIVANKLLDQTMTSLENKLYGKYPDEEVDNFAVEAMEIIGRVEGLLVKLIEGGYRENY